MSKLSLLVFIVIVAVNCIYYVDGLRCYVCSYKNNNGNVVIGDKSCNSGSKPISDFSQECNTKMAMPSAFRSQREIPKSSNKTVSVGEFIAARGLSTEQINWSCSKVVMEGHEDDDVVKATYRSCFPIIDGDSCKDDTAGNWMDNAINDLWTVYVAALSDGLDRTDPVTACKCTSENCNSALSSVSISLTVMIGSVSVGFLTNTFKFI